MTRVLAIWAFLLLGAASAQAQGSVRDLYQALGLPEVIAVMREEGISYGQDIEDQMFMDRGGATWTAVVEQIHGPAAMEDVVLDGLERGLEGTDLTLLLDFFTAPRGREIVAFELGARKALNDPMIEEAALQAYTDMVGENAPRLTLLRAFEEANDLVESNVMGAMNSSMAFYTGLSEGDAFGGTLTEEQILSDVWNQEAEIRADTIDWVFSFLAMAYQPLDDSDLEAYIALSRSPEGRAMNRALFSAFDDMFVSISRNMGAAAARFMIGQEL